MTLIDLDKTHQGWSKFAGEWSEGQNFWFGKKPTTVTPALLFGEGPATPNFRTTSIDGFWHEDSD